MNQSAQTLIATSDAGQRSPDLFASVEFSEVRGLAAWSAVVHAYNACEQATVAALKPLGVKLAQHEVLMQLLQHGCLSQQQLAQRSYFTKSRMSLLLAEMAALGWVKRDDSEADRRAKRITLTEAGLRLAHQAAQAQKNIIDAMMNPLSDSDIDLMRTLARKSAHALGVYTTAQVVHASAET